MNLNSVSSYTSAVAMTSSYTKKSSDPAKTSSADETSDAAAVYEKSSETSSSSKTDRSEIVAQLKADLENRTNQLLDIVKKTIAGQGNAISKTDDMWKFLASGNFTVDAQTKAQAQADIAEDGYWGVEQTSDRILDFAKALSGGDSSKAETYLKAFKKGFEEATKTWGKTLPDISQKTYDAVIEKFNKWQNGDED